MPPDSSKPGEYDAREADRARDLAAIERSAAPARIASLTTQRDVALAAARRAWLAEAHWRQQASSLEQRAHVAEQQAAAWQEQAVHWQLRFEGLRGRLEALLRRFGLMRAARMMPGPVRRFARTRLLGSERP